MGRAEGIDVSEGGDAVTLALERWEQAQAGGDWADAVAQVAGDNGSGQMSLLEAMGRECSPNA